MFKKVREGKTCRLDTSGQTGQKSRRGEAWGSNWEDLEGPTVWSEVLDRVWRLQCFCGQVDVTARRHVTDTVRLQRSFQTKTRSCGGFSAPVRQPRNTPENKHVQGAPSALLHFPHFPMYARAHIHTRICTHARTAQRQSASKRGDVKSFTHPRRSAGAPCCQRSRRRGSGGMSRSEARCPAGLSPVPQPVINTDRQRDVHTHTHTRARAHTQGVSACQTCVGISRWPQMCVPCFTPSLPGKRLSEQRPRPSAVTRRTHTHTHTPSGSSWLLCAHCSVHTPRRLTHTLTRGFVCASATPTFIVRQESNPRVLTPALFRLSKAPPPPPPCSASLHATASLVMTGVRPAHTVTCRCFRLHVSWAQVSTCWIPSTPPPLQIPLNKQLNLRSTSAASAPSGHFPLSFLDGQNSRSE